MPTHIFIRLRSTISMMVLLAIFAALLPARDTFAQSSPVVKFSRVEFNQEVYENWIMQQFSTGNKKALNIENMIRVNFVADQLLSDEAIYDASVVLEAVDVLNERFYKRLGERGGDEAYRDGLPNTVVAEAMFAAALETPPFRDNVNQVYGRLKDVGNQILAGTTHSATDLAAARTFLEDNTLENATEKLLIEQNNEMIARAKDDPEFARAWDAFIVSQTDDDAITLEDLRNFDAKRFLAEHPELGVPQEIQNAIKPDGSLEISVAELEQLAKNEFATINASIDDMQKTLVEISVQQGELVDFMNDQKARQKAQALAEAKAKEHQLRLQAANSAVSIISTLVSFEDPKLGKQIAVVGQSVIKIGDSLRSWMEATAGLSALSKLGSLSTVAMTGNVLGAVMNVVSLFGPEQPTPEQMILEEIGKLRQQVDQLRTEMHTRFDQVDKQLTAIYSTMNERFNQIDIKLGKITTSLEEIQESLLTLGMALDRMERNNFEYFDALGRRPLREAMNGALGYQERTGLEMPYQPDFVNYENVFHTWGTVNAFDALSAGPTERNYSDGQVLAELSAAPLDANLNYLNGWLSAHGLTPFATKRLPSPRDWAFASRAYAELGQDWPEHLLRIAPQRQAALDSVGNDLQQALQNISTIQTGSGPQGNAPLWSELNSYYNAKLGAIDSALVASETAFVKDVQTELERSVPFDLYGGLDQTLAYQPTDFATMTCGGGYSEDIRIPAPSNLKNMVLAYNRYALAEYLRLNQMAVCWYPELVDKFQHCQNGVCEDYGFVTVQIVVKSPMGEVARHTFRGYPAKWNSDLRSLVVSQWDAIYRPKIEGDLAGAAPPAADTAPITSKLTNRLAELQRAHVGRVQSELSTGSIRGKAVELAGAKKLLESLITLGFPQALANDDFLRSLLFSKESLIDDQQIVSAYATPAAPATISEAVLLVNPRVKLLEAGKKRHEALGGLLTDYLSSISTQNYREDNALIGGARFDMALARAFADPGAPLPGQSRTIFLPLLGR